MRIFWKKSPRLRVRERPYSATLIAMTGFGSVRGRKPWLCASHAFQIAPQPAFGCHVAAGCDHYVTKPYIPMQLAAEVSPAVARS